MSNYNRDMDEHHNLSTMLFRVKLWTVDVFVLY